MSVSAIDILNTHEVTEKDEDQGKYESNCDANYIRSGKEAADRKGAIENTLNGKDTFRIDHQVDDESVAQQTQEDEHPSDSKITHDAMSLEVPSQNIQGCEMGG